MRPGEVVRSDERLRLPAMLGLGAQRILAMFGATAIVPVLTGFSVSTTLRFSGIGTLLFCLITRNRVPCYTGSSFAFIAPVIAAKAGGGVPLALGGIVCAGVALLLVGLIIDRVGYGIVAFLLPPVVTGAIVCLIGLNLAPVARDQFSEQAGIALFTLSAILLATVGLRGLGAQLSVFLASVRATRSRPCSATSTGRACARPPGSGRRRSRRRCSTVARSCSSSRRSCSC